MNYDIDTHHLPTLFGKPSSLGEEVTLSRIGEPYTANLILCQKAFTPMAPPKKILEEVGLYLYGSKEVWSTILIPKVREFYDKLSRAIHITPLVHGTQSSVLDDIKQLKEEMMKEPYAGVRIKSRLKALLFTVNMSLGLFDEQNILQRRDITPGKNYPEGTPIKVFLSDVDRLMKINKGWRDTRHNREDRR